MAGKGDTVNTKLPYGAQVDTSSLSAVAPSGDKLDYIKCTTQLTAVGTDVVLKLIHMFTMRGRETKKNSRGSRIRYNGDLSGKPLHIFISFPN